ncbi:MAG: hypothetical protein IKE28_10825 [Solobacterium sp.]|nr:hypothetical protein [Solobacterium sp.]
MPSEKTSDPVRRCDRTVLCRLYSCFVQGIGICSAAALLHLSEQEVIVSYMRFSLGEVSARLRRFEHP